MSTHRRNYRAENRRAFVKKVYVSLKDEDKAKILLRDLDALIWKLTFKRGAEPRRDLLIQGLRGIADELEQEGEEFNRASIELRGLSTIKLPMPRRPRLMGPKEFERSIRADEPFPEPDGSKLE
jgi:hypothetical protein